MIGLGNPLGIIWLVPVLLMTLLWIRTPVFVSAAGKRILLGVKLGVLGLLVVALLDPRWETQRFQEDFRVVFALDVSPSVDPGAREAAFDAVASLAADLPEHATPQYLLFSGSHAACDRLPRGGAAASGGGGGTEGELLARLAREPSTDLGGALEEGLKAIPPGRRGRLYLFTDGGDTHGGAGAATRRLAEANLPVSVVPLEPLRGRDQPRLIKAGFPDHLFPGEEFAARFLVANPAGATLTLDLRGSDGTAAQVSIPGGEAGLSAHVVKLRPQTRGVIGYVAQVAAAGPGGIPSRRFQTVTVRSLPRALVFEESPADGRFLRDLLTAEKIEFATAHPGSWPADLAAALPLYPCVILNNIHRKHFSVPEMEALRQAVRDGTGLLMTGGPNAFGLGEWTETPVEELLPVRLPRRTVNQPLALILVLDSSGSMFGESWDYLIAATKEILRLCRGHYVGIIMFNHLPSWVLPLQQIDELDEIYQTLDQYYPGGGTVFSPRRWWR